MKGFIGDIEERTEVNDDYRRVLFTGQRLQVVLMALEPGDETGEETHPNTDQYFQVEKGKGEILMDGQATSIDSDVAMVIPAGTRHNIRNTGERPLKFYTLYAPPEHPDGTVHHTKADAEKAEHITK